MNIQVDKYIIWSSYNTGTVAEDLNDICRIGLQFERPVYIASNKEDILNGLRWYLPDYDTEEIKVNGRSIDILNLSDDEAEELCKMSANKTIVYNEATKEIEFRDDVQIRFTVTLNIEESRIDGKQIGYESDTYTEEVFKDLVRVAAEEYGKDKGVEVTDVILKFEDYNCGGLYSAEVNNSEEHRFDMLIQTCEAE